MAMVLEILLRKKLVGTATRINENSLTELNIIIIVTYLIVVTIKNGY